MFNNTVLKCAQSSQQKFLERLKTCEKLKKRFYVIIIVFLFQQKITWIYIYCFHGLKLIISIGKSKMQSDV